MPRTRTKFIWPPSMTTNMASKASPDASPVQHSPISEPRAKRPRVSSLSASRTAALTEEQTLLRDDDSLRRDREKQNNHTKRNSQSEAPRPSFSDIIAAYVKEPMPVQIKRYQEWRRHGSVHDDYCFVCHQPKTQSLVPCYTCRRAFHGVCMPPGWTYDEHRQWYCPVCVRRNWHVKPPTVTPPTSPPLSARHSSVHDIPDRPLTANTAASQPGTLASQSSPENEQALSILAEISRSMSREEPSKSTPDSVTLSTPRCQVTGFSPLLTGQSLLTSTSSRRNESNIPSPSSQSFPLLDSHARKSRFATLPTEIDGALWVLYRELENATTLRQHITELEAEIVKLRQDVNIRDNQLILSQRAAQTGHVPHIEIDRLKVQAAKGEAAIHEMEMLRTKNESLEKELKDAKADTALLNETLNEWKGKLINLIGN